MDFSFGVWVWRGGSVGFCGFLWVCSVGLGVGFGDGLWVVAVGDG